MKFKFLVKVDVPEEADDVAQFCGDFENGIRAMIDMVMAEEYPEKQYTLLSSVY